jgi:hypothetical protein
MAFAMKFSAEEIALAQLFKAFGLEWHPACGQYVLDQANLVECPSPFQPKVYYILDLKHFLRRAGTIEHLKTQMCWLPDWEQTRDILQGLGVAPEAIAERLQSADALANRTERLELYRLVEEVMTGAFNL